MFGLNDKDKQIVSDLAEFIRKTCDLPTEIDDFSMITTGKADSEHNFETAVSFVQTVFDNTDISQPSAYKEKAVVCGIAACLLMPAPEFISFVRSKQNNQAQVDLSAISNHYHVPISIARERGVDLGLF